ncbi:MAG: hypothetical protein L6R42_007745 [Xanthoria sp. 1 TBL-2021]|nr:MAG: hypothetical protein L6R42_007745 [Xanthoria sp. 1 TBL-2021]
MEARISPNSLNVQSPQGMAHVRYNAQEESIGNDTTETMPRIHQRTGLLRADYLQRKWSRAEGTAKLPSIDRDCDANVLGFSNISHSSDNSQPDGGNDVSIADSARLGSTTPAEQFSRPEQGPTLNSP